MYRFELYPVTGILFSCLPIIFAFYLLFICVHNLILIVFSISKMSFTVLSRGQAWNISRIKLQTLNVHFKSIFVFVFITQYVVKTSWWTWTFSSYSTIYCCKSYCCLTSWCLLISMKRVTNSISHMMLAVTATNQA